MHPQTPTLLRSERTPLSPRGTRAAGPWGRPRPPPECAPRGHSGQRRARVDPPHAAPRRFPEFQVSSSPGCRPRPLPARRSRPPRSPPGRGTENLESWQPGESANARQDPRFPDSQLVDSRSAPATAAAGLRLADAVIPLASRASTPATGSDAATLPAIWGPPSERHAGRA